ncbi:MAG: hypothetical protein AABX38_02815 [Candidatus Micrarchaeota archaeon]
MSDFQIQYHPKFFRDLETLNSNQLDIVNKKLEIIKQSPDQFKHLKGKNNCYSIIIEGMRLVYYFDKVNLWFLILENRKSVYEEYVKRLYTLQSKLASL